MEPSHNRPVYEESLDRVDAKLNLIARRAHANDARHYELALQEFIIDSRRRQIQGASPTGKATS